MFTRFGICALACGLAFPALATGEIVCRSGDDVTVDMNVGRLEVLSVNRITVTISGETWSSQPEVAPGTPITVGQAFGDDAQLLVDITDGAVDEVLGRLRVFQAAEGDVRAAGGVFTFKGKGAFAVDCSEPE